MASVRLAFVGAASEMSPWLIQSLSRVGSFEAICDKDAENDAAKLHARWAFSDVSAMLREAEPDGVVLHRLLGHRARLIKQCLAAGAGVLVTGAPGSAAACKRLASFARLSGHFILAAPAIRFSPALRLARRLVESGKLGAPISMTLRSTRRGSPHVGPEDSGAMPSDQVFEAVDIVHYLLGPMQRVFSLAHDDGALVASAMTGSGVPVSLVFHNRGSAEAIGLDLEIRASDGTRLRLDRNLRLTCGSGTRVDAARRLALATADPVVELGYEGLLAEFRRCIEVGGAGLGLVGPVATIVAATEAILASAERGRPMSPKRVQTGSESATSGAVGTV